VEVAVRRVLQRGSQAIELLRWYAGDTIDTFVAFHETSAALALLRIHLDNPLRMRTLHDALAEALAYPDMVGLDDWEVLAQLAWRLVRDHGRVTPLLTSRSAVQAGTYRQAVTPEAEAEEQPMAPAAITETAA
jgi:hypothetical protein